MKRRKKREYELVKKKRERFNRGNESEGLRKMTMM